ncbi:sulfite reductase subunit alpha [Opitutus terrae]|uniref:assimilatory sulfite reductase (NADPH) n=1 Tax=Opitutus terrae (strain DSM 11246 / JCM 15787 / PB90-1) TaxID=452637 RepID=B1ZVT6_OPITP|nr:sulfite reductase subunit alpha [Opitutus terrae]ACB75022.1 FAD-binding domain protein [Opitutus terrae PB90-1]
MHTVPVLPDSAPFTLEQRAWLNGYLAGLFSRGPVADVAGGVDLGRPASTSPATAKPTRLAPLTILFGSQTGTCESLAKRAAKEAGKRGFAATVRDMGAFTIEQLAQEQNLLVITSTYGEGEPPDNAKALHAALTAATKAPSRDEGVAAPAAGEVLPGAATPPWRLLGALRYSVCALGDTNYVHFCQCGKEFDAALEKLGAARAAAAAECDLDYEAKFTSWLDGALSGLTEVGRVIPNAPSTANLSGAVTAAGVGGVADPGQPSSPSPATPTQTETLTRSATPDGANGPRFSRQNPFPALVLASRRLNGAGSAKQVQHVEFDLGDSGFVYAAGDALGVYAHNCPELVGDVLAVLGCDGEEAVAAPDGSSITLRRALTEFYDLGKPTDELLAVVSPCLQAARGRDMGETPALPRSAPHHVIDALLAAGGGKLAPAEFVRTLKRLQPRLYSISSSPKAHAGQVHLTVSAVRYEKDARARKGVCSTFLADRVQPGETRIGVFVHRNAAFRLPESGDVPVIMVGPGTGIAPFRAFLHERRVTGARGRNWLLFGDQHAATDFLYQEELAELQRGGVLTRLDTAFSRDQAEKVYVQHRMLENARELLAWLEQGAHFYVCGDASRMAKDVDAALQRVVELAGGRTAEQAADYVQTLRTSKRYQRDVY